MKLYSSLNYLGFPGGSLVKNSPPMQEMWVQTLGWEDTLGKEMETHSGMLAWEIPWPEDLGELPSLEMKRVGHN